MDCTTSILVMESSGVRRILNSAVAIVTPQAFVAVRRYWPVIGTWPTTGESVIRPASGTGVGTVSTGPLIAVICTLVAFETFHESVGWPPGSTRSGVNRNRFTTGFPPTWTRF
jgi:hypothetical protein